MAFDGLNTGLETTEERVSEHEDVSTETSKTKTQRTKTDKTPRNTHGLQDNYKNCNKHIMGIPGREVTKKQDI